MSLRDLVEGECGGANSMMHLTSHFVQDRALKEEGIGRPFPHSVEDFSNSDADQLVQQFLGDTLGHPPQTFRMDSLLEEIRGIEMNAPIQAPGVAALAIGHPGQNSIWADQYLESGKQFDQVHGDNTIWTTAPPGHQSGEVFEFGFGPNWAEEYLQSSEQNHDAANAWIEEAAKEESSHETNDDVRDAAHKLLETADDPKFAYSKFMKFMGMIDDGGITIEDGNVVSNSATDEWTDEFKGFEQAQKSNSSWAQQYLPSVQPTSTVTREDEVKSEASYPSQTDMMTMLKDQWKKATEDTETDWLSEFSDQYEPYKNYQFSADNPMKTHSNPLEEGKKKLAEGNLPSAVLCFECAVQATPESAEAWLLLGTTQAENEQDPSAIPALKKCLTLDPTNLVAIMALAVCYTNESYQNQACQLLKDWLRLNPKYTDLVHLDAEGTHHPPMDVVSSMLSQSSYQEVKDIYISAARRNPQGTIDPNVQCGLGVLFNLSGEFDKAVDCFKAGLQVKPQDSRMWNRLGATLANGNRSEEAVDAYHNALQLAPGFIRARYNLGITCVNLKAYRESAEHLLTALNQQAAGRGAEGQSSWSAMSDSIWSTLRLVMSLLDRHDLFFSLENRDLKRLNSEFGIE